MVDDAGLARPRGAVGRLEASPEPALAQDSDRDFMGKAAESRPSAPGIAAAATAAATGTHSGAGVLLRRGLQAGLLAAAAAAAASAGRAAAGLGGREDRPGRDGTGDEAGPSWLAQVRWT